MWTKIENYYCIQLTTSMKASNMIATKFLDRFLLAKIKQKFQIQWQKLSETKRLLLAFEKDFGLFLTSAFQRRNYLFFLLFIFLLNKYL